MIAVIFLYFNSVGQNVYIHKSNFYKHFKGKAVRIADNGKKLEYHITLNMRKEADDISGSFYSTKENVFYTLTGKYNPDGKFELHQYDPKFYLIGIFKGSFSSEKTIIGNWKDVNENKEYTFALQENYENSVQFMNYTDTSIYHIGDDQENPFIKVNFNYLHPANHDNQEALDNMLPTLTKYIFGPFSAGTDPRQLLEFKRKQLFIEYRNIVERQFNMAKKAKMLHEDFLYMYNRETKFNTSVYFNEDNILTLSKDSLEQAGGEAVTEGFSYFVIDMTTGKQIRPRDVFFYPNFKELMADLYVEKIKAWLSADSEAELIQEGFDREFLKYNNNIYVDKFGLGFYFNPYEINERYVKVYFFWHEIAKYLKESSPVSHLFPKTLVFEEREASPEPQRPSSEDGEEGDEDYFDEYEEFIFLPSSDDAPPEDNEDVIYPDDNGIIYPDE